LFACVIFGCIHLISAAVRDSLLVLL